TLARLVIGELVDPAPAMAAGLVSAGPDHAGEFRRILDRHGGGRYRGRDAVLLEQAEDARRTGADAVLVVAFVRIIADRDLRRHAKLVDRLGPLVAAGDRHLRAFLDVDDEGHGEASPLGPGKGSVH